MIYCGIDFGLSGGIAMYGDKGVVLHKMPLKDGEMDALTVYRMLAFLKGKPHVVCFEKIQRGGIFGTGKVQAWSLATQIGLIKGFCVALGLKYMEVAPKKWQSAMFFGVKEYKRKGLGGKDKTEFVNDTKLRAYYAFLKHFPKINVPKGPRGRILDGCIDAALLMKYSMIIKTT